MSRLRSFRAQLVAAFTAIAILPVAGLGVYAYRSERALVEREAVATVRVVATARLQMLQFFLTRNRTRNANFAVTALTRCPPGEAQSGCLRAALDEFVRNEGAIAGALSAPGLAIIRVGDAEMPLSTPAVPGQIGSVERGANGVSAFVTDATADGGAHVTIARGTRPIEEIFAEHFGLGESGETFVADGRGYFVTPARYPSSQGRAEPLRGQAIARCLAGEADAVVEPDYRGERVVQGFLAVPELGGGCVMAHIDYAEAMRPATQLRDNAIVATAAAALLAASVAAVLAGLLTAPLRRLSDGVRALERGEFDVELPEDASSIEVTTLAAALRQLGPAMRSALALEGERARRVAAERAAVEQADLYAAVRDAVAVRDTFIAVASHELRTPLTALKLQVDLLCRVRAPTAEDLARRSEVIARQVARMIALVDGLLDVARIARGTLHMERAPVDLAATAREVVDRHLPALARAGCVVNLTADGPLVGAWDPLRIEQILVNLLSNAQKYGAGAPIEIEVAPAQLASGAGAARLRVTDHGIGIPPAEHAHIFERFGRAVSERHFGGLGLGLWITREIVGALGGTIMVASEEGQGATFVVTLPLDPPPRAGRDSSPT